MAQMLPSEPARKVAFGAAAAASLRHSKTPWSMHPLQSICRSPSKQLQEGRALLLLARAPPTVGWGRRIYGRFRTCPEAQTF